jgi:creatinine amidohydrolase/Fe(II)-dependent formamide hydrolase-like protein
MVPLVLACLVEATAAAHAQVLRIAELNTDQIRALDRRKTAVVIPTGILEEHGPYLPVFADGYVAERIARSVAESIAARPEWTALIFPMVPVGAEGANEVVGKPGFPGTFSVSAETLRALFMDLADALGEQGFRWVFVINAHDGSVHQRTLHEVGDYFAGTHRGRFVNLLDLEAPDVMAAVTAGGPTDSTLTVPPEGGGPHGGWGETSTLLFLEPALVSSAHRDALDVKTLPQTRRGSGADLDAMVKAAESPDWPGYFGSPRLASPALGAEGIRRQETYARLLTARILDGLDPRTLKRSEETSFGELARASPAYQRQVQAYQERERARSERHQQWIREHSRPR